MSELSAVEPETLPISVVIAVYRRPELVSRAVRSVLGQRPARAAEVLVVDDGSADGTADAAEAAGARVIRHPENRGCAAARNTGVGEATQPWIALLDSDDEWLPHHLATMWPLRDGHAVVAVSALRCGADPAEDRYFGPVARRPVVLRSPAELMFPANVISASTVMVRRGAILAAGGFDTRRRYSEDFDLWLRVLERGTAIVSPTVTALYHQHGGQKSERPTGPRETKRAIEAEYVGRAWWSPRIVERRLAKEGWDDLRSGLRAGRRRDAARAALRLLSRPRDLLAVAAIWRWRLGIRRRSSAVARDGRPTIAVWGDGAELRRRTEAAADGRLVADLGGRTELPSAVSRIARRPPGIVVAGSRVEVLLATVLGVETVRDRPGLAEAVSHACGALGSAAAGNFGGRAAFAPRTPVRPSTTPTSTSHSLSSLPDTETPRRQGLLKVLRDLESWGLARDWAGYDLYDGLNATRLAPKLWRAPMGRRLTMQVVKRSPVNLRPTLGIEPEQDSASVAWVVSSYAKGGFRSEEEELERLHHALDILERLRLKRYDYPCWGYHYDFQSRVFFYSKEDPNAIATTYAGMALLDAYERLGDRRLLDAARGVGEFFLNLVPQTETGAGAYFGYLVGDRSPIHNSNLHICGLLARLSEHFDDERYAPAVSAGVRYSLERQRPDGAWPYGERPNLRWVDNFHTGYVLDSLRICLDSGLTPEVEPALDRGLAYYREHLFLADGTPKYFSGKTYPIDTQSVAQAIQTFAIAASRDASFAEPAWKVFEWAVANMRRPDGAFYFQRRRHWVNPVPHMRGVVASMLLGLVHLVNMEPAQAD